MDATQTGKKMVQTGRTPVPQACPSSPLCNLQEHLVEEKHQHWFQRDTSPRKVPAHHEAEFGLVVTTVGLGPSLETCENTRLDQKNCRQMLRSPVADPILAHTTHIRAWGGGVLGEGREKQEERRRASSPDPRSCGSFHLSRPNGLFPVDWDLGIHSSSNPRQDAS